MQLLFFKNRLILGGIIALTIVGIGAFVHYGPPQQEGYRALDDQDISRVDTLATSSQDIGERDTDVDGIPDWEEHLYGSNPKKFDTDSDGTPDGEEVRLNRNPALANTAKRGVAPTDLLEEIQDPNFATSSTDILGLKKEFFAKFLAKEAEQIRNTTYRDLLRKFDAKKVIPTNQLIDLRVDSDNSAEALRTYGNNFGLLIDKYTKRTHRTEDEIVTDALKIKKDSALKELQLPAISYKNFSSDLKALSVPSSLAPSHLQVVNGYEGMSKGLLVMQVLFSDPINGAGGYQVYTTQKVEVTKGYAQLVVLLAKNNVIFEKHEAGFPFSYKQVEQKSTTAPTTP